MSLISKQNSDPSLLNPTMIFLQKPSGDRVPSAAEVASSEPNVIVDFVGRPFVWFGD